MAIVYKVTNTINGKAYAGQTIYDLEHRWNRHLSAARSGSKFRFHAAIRKYGPDPWKREVVYENDDMAKIREVEAKIILEENLIGKAGYNAKPGGCGGWIVTDKESWLEKLKVASQGLNNTNASETTNEQMIQLLLELTLEKGYIPGHTRLSAFAKSKGHHIPKHFTSFRFGGKYRNLAREVESITGLKYNGFFRDDIQKQKLRDANTGKIKVIINETGQKRTINLEDFDTNTMTKVKKEKQK
jgi:hypothetical protein